MYSIRRKKKTFEFMLSRLNQLRLDSFTHANVLHQLILVKINVSMLAENISHCIVAR